MPFKNGLLSEGKFVDLSFIKLKKLFGLLSIVLKDLAANGAPFFCFVTEL